MKQKAERNINGVVKPSRDLLDGTLGFRIWFMLALHDTKQRYRRSILGPFWFVLNNLLFISILGILYSQLFGEDIRTYVPYLSAGFITWQLIAATLIEGSTAMVMADNLIKQVNLPMSSHAYRVAARNLVILVHNAPLFIFFPLVMGVSLGVELLLLPISTLILFINSSWVCIVFGLLGARFRDVQPIMQNIVTISFFFTPILWKADLLAERAVYVHLNPFVHFIELFRMPLLGQWPSDLSLIIVSAITVIGTFLAWLSLTLYRNQVAFWI